MKFISTLLFLFFSMTVLLQAQENSILKYIPKKNMAVIANIDAYNTYQKLEEDSRKDLNVSSKIADMLVGLTQDSMDLVLRDKIAKQLENPKEIGLELQKEAFFWIQNANNPKAEVYMFDAQPMFYHAAVPVLDEAKFKAFLVEIYGTDALKNAKKNGIAQNLIVNGTLLNWTAERLFVVRSSIEQSFFDEGALFEERLKAILELQANVLGNEYKIENTIAGDADFQNHLKNKADMAIWMDYSNLSSSIPMNEVPSQGRETAEAFLEMFMGFKMAAYVHVDQGEFSLEYKSYMNEKIANIARGASSLKPNRKLYKYIKGDNLMAFYAGQFNIKGYAEAFSKEISEVLNKTKEGVLVNNLWDIVDIFVDEDEAYTLWNGDFAMALTGLKTIQKEKIDYKYNPDTDTWDEEVSTNEQVMPIGVVGGSYQSEENVMKFIKLGVNAGGLSQRAEGVYAVAGAQKELGMDVFVILNKGVLLITNDSLLTVKRKGFSGKEKFPVIEWKNVLTTMQYGFVDVNKFVDVVADYHEKADKVMPKDLKKAKDVVTRMEMKVYKPVGNTMSSEFKIIFTDKNKSTLNTLFRIGQKAMQMGPMFGLPGQNQGGFDEFEEFEEFEKEEEEGVKKL